jgi:hypothetical protein
MNNIPHDRKPHHHQHIINAWAEGKRIQAYNGISLGWEDCESKLAPCFAPSQDYRIKPEPKPPYKRYAQVAKTDSGVQISFLTPNKLCVDNVEFTFDGDTHQLISVKKI